MLSPSEEKGLALGLRLLTYDGRHKRDTVENGSLTRTRVYARFESPPLPASRGTTQRHVLHSFSKSRAGAWRHAIRWLRQLQKGELR